jgi:hypothetical protein
MTAIIALRTVPNASNPAMTCAGATGSNVHDRYVQRRLLGPLAGGTLTNGAAAVFTSILAIGPPVFTSILATGTPIVTSISAIVAPALAPLHSGRLGLSIWCRQHRGWHSHAKCRSQSQNPKGSSTRDRCCFKFFMHGQPHLGLFTWWRAAKSSGRAGLMKSARLGRTASMSKVQATKSRC